MPTYSVLWLRALKEHLTLEYQERIYGPQLTNSLTYDFSVSLALKDYLLILSIYDSWVKIFINLIPTGNFV